MKTPPAMLIADKTQPSAMPVSEQPPLRIGLLLDDYLLPAWAGHMLARIHRLTCARIDLVALVRPASPAPVSGLRGWLRQARRAIENTAVGAAPGNHSAFALVCVRELLADVPAVTIQPRREQDLVDFRVDDIEPVVHADLDVLLHLGSWQPTGVILAAARHGVWSFWTSEQPEGFWETLERRPYIQTQLRLFTPAGATTLLESTSCVERTSVAANRDRAYWKTASFAPRAFRELHRVGSAAFIAGLAPTQPVPVAHRPSCATLARFAVRRIVEHRQDKLLEKVRRDQWLLLFAFHEGEPPAYEEFRKLTPPRDRFWADPHVLVRNGVHYIFLEEYLYATHRAHISVLVLGRDGRHEQPVPIIERPYHMSYPHLFEWGGELFMVPETKSNRTIEVYRCVEFPYRWELETRLMEDVDAVDTTLLEHEGRWWLFANMIENPGASSWDALFLFSSDSPLSQQWIGHPQNPIVSDVTRARPAGPIFSRDGKLYRPSQNSSYRYGYGFNISEITELSGSRYAERLITRVEPTWDPALLAVHTLSSDGGLTVIDAMQRRWRWPRP